MRMSFRTSFRSALSIGAIAATMILAGSARADVFTFDTTLASPNTNAATNAPNSSSNNASWYNGSGNPQGGWTVDSANGIEVGLRAKYRQNPGVIDTPSDDYVVVPGLQTGTNKAAWNYEFSIDLRPNGVGSLTIADISANTTLTVTDLTTGATNTIHLFDPTYAPDDSGFGTTNGTTGPDRINESPATLAAFEAGWGAQNSENATFGNWPLASLQAFNPNAADTYEFDLQVVTSAGAVLATNDIEVQVTPEPSAVILLGTMILAAFVLGRRRLTA
jgi:hypothetical protein